MPNRTKGILLALFSSALFGLIPFFSIPLIEEGIGIATILFYRFLFSTIIMGMVCLLKKINIKISSKSFVILFVLSLFFAATSLGLIASYSYISSGIATTIHYLFPTFVAVVMMFFYKEKRSLSVLAFSLLALLGVGILCWTNESLNFLGVIYALITVVTYGMYIVGTEKFGLEESNPYIRTFYILLFGTVLFLIYALSTTGIDHIDQTKTWVHLVILSLFTTVLADFCLILAIDYSGASISAVLGVLEPVVAFAVGVLFLSEPFSIHALFGLCIVLSAITLVVWSSSKQK